MRYLTLLLLVPALVITTTVATRADTGFIELAEVEVSVTVGGAILKGAVVRLDLNNNGIWEEHLGEPEVITGDDGIAVFGGIVSIGDTEQDRNDSVDAVDMRPSRILTGNLRGTVGSSEVRFDFVLPSDGSVAHLGLYDLRGRLLTQVHGDGDLEMTAPAGLSSGVYFVKLSSGNEAPVAHRITSVGRGVQTIRAQQVSMADAIAAGWLPSRERSGQQKSLQDAHEITVLVSHVDHGAMTQEQTLVVGLNEFSVDIAESPPGFVYIPPGTFTMGSPEDEPGRDATREVAHRVTLTRGFHMAKYQVTEGLWHQVMGGTAQNPLLPKISVSWEMAIEFCNALSLREDLTPAYTINGSEGDVTWDQNADGYRLPTEAEWEYACRAWSTQAYHNDTNCLCSDHEANFAGSNQGQQVMGCSAGVVRGTRTEVGAFPPNSWGLHDMHGNALECIWDTYRADYEELDSVDPMYAPGQGVRRVIRSGSWNSSAQHCRSAARSSVYFWRVRSDLGLRVVR